MGEKKPQELAPGELEKRIGVFTDEAMPRIVEAGHKVRRKYDSVGRGPGDTRFPIERNKAFREAIREVNGELAQIVFAARGQAGLPLVRVGVGRVLANTMEYYASVALWPYGPADRAIVEGLRTKFKADLERDAATLLEDFTTGHVWGKPLVSPDAQARASAPAAIGPDSPAGTPAAEPQVSVEEAMSRLVGRIDAVLRSSAVVLLPDADRKGLTDILDDIRDEATEDQPDASRLRRWTERLLARLQALNVAVPDAPVKATLREALTALGEPPL